MNTAARRSTPPSDPVDLTQGSRRHRWRTGDGFLYPALLDLSPWRPPPTRWDRFLWTVAGWIDERTGRRERRRLHTEGVHRYQRELGRRATLALIGQIREGWWIGPPPYGYRITIHQVTVRGRRIRRHRLAVDHRRAPVVPRIFMWFVRYRLGPTRIAARLAADPDRYPPPVDHRTGRPRPWTRGVVRGILSNPAYLGYVIRGRTRRGQPQTEDRWIWSLERSHEALVEADLFWAARDNLYPALRPPEVDRGSAEAVA